MINWRLAIPALLIAATFLLAVPVLAAYYVDLDVTESNGTDYNMLAINASLNIDYLADHGYINATGLDVRVRTTGGSDLPFMLCSDKVLFAAPITGDLTNTFQLTTGNTPMSSFDIVTGYGGNITIADAAALELGNNFSIELDGWFDTSTANSDPSAPIIAGTNTSTDTVEPFTVDLPSGVEAGDLLIILWQSNDASATTLDWPPSGWTSLASQGAGTTRTFAMAYKIAAGNESSVNVTADNNYITSAHISYRITNYRGVPESAHTAGETSSSTPNPPNLSPSWSVAPTLWIAGYGQAADRTISVYPTNYTASEHIINSGSYPAALGTATRKLAAAAEDPTAFTLSGSGLHRSFTIGVNGIMPEPYFVGKNNSFYIYPKSGEISVALVSLPAIVVNATVSSGDSTVTASANTTHLAISIDGTPQDTIALGGVSASDNAEDWVIANMRYANYYTHTVDGTLLITYQPDEILTGTTLDNESGASYDGAITFGSNPAGISVETSGLEFTPSSYYTTTEDTTADVLDVSTTSPLVGINLARLERNPVRLVVEFISEVSSFTETLVWILGSLLILLGASLATFILTRGKLDIATIVALGLAIAFYVMGSLPLAVPILCAMGMVAAIIREGQVSW